MKNLILLVIIFSASVVFADPRLDLIPRTLQICIEKDSMATGRTNYQIAEQTVYCLNKYNDLTITQSDCTYIANEFVPDNQLFAETMVYCSTK